MAGLHLYFYYGKNIPKLIKEGQKPSNILNTYVHYFSISVFSNYDHDSYDTDGQKVMRMGFGGENLVANAGLGDGGGGGHGHGHSHNPYDTDNQEVGVIRLGFGGENLVAIAGLGGDVHGDVHGHVRNRASGHVHSPVPCHVQEGVYCVESWLHHQYHDDSDDNNDGDVGGIRCDNNDSDAHYHCHHHNHHLHCPRQSPFHCHYLVLCPYVLTILCPQSLRVRIHPRRREDFRPPGRWGVGAKLGLMDVHQISLDGSFSTVQMKKI